MPDADRNCLTRFLHLLTCTHPTTRMKYEQADGFSELCGLSTSSDDGYVSTDLNHRQKSYIGCSVHRCLPHKLEDKEAAHLLQCAIINKRSSESCTPTFFKELNSVSNNSYKSSWLRYDVLCSSKSENQCLYTIEELVHHLRTRLFGSAAGGSEQQSLLVNETHFCWAVSHAIAEEARSQNQLLWTSEALFNLYAVLKAFLFDEASWTKSFGTAKDIATMPIDQHDALSLHVLERCGLKRRNQLGRQRSRPESIYLEWCSQIVSPKSPWPLINGPKEPLGLGLARLLERRSRLHGEEALRKAIENAGELEIRKSITFLDRKQVAHLVVLVGYLEDEGTLERLVNFAVYDLTPPVLAYWLAQIQPQDTRAREEVAIAQDIVQSCANRCIGSCEEWNAGGSWIGR